MGTQRMERRLVKRLDQMARSHPITTKRSTQQRWLLLDIVQRRAQILLRHNNMQSESGLDRIASILILLRLLLWSRSLHDYHNTTRRASVRNRAIRNRQKK